MAQQVSETLYLFPLCIMVYEVDNGVETRVAGAQKAGPGARE
jgi:hypothetical protein